VQAHKRAVVWLCHARLGVVVGQHCGARGVQIGVIVGVVDMPVRVDHRFQRRIAEPIERFFQLRPGRQRRNVSTTILPSGPFNTTTFPPGPESKVRFSASGCEWIGTVPICARMAPRESVGGVAAC